MRHAQGPPQGFCLELCHMYGSTFCEGKLIRRTTLFRWVDLVFHLYGCGGVLTDRMPHYTQSCMNIAAAYY
jgi:hypothetical protein